MFPLFARVGGKSKGSNRIIDLIPEHHTYVEPFCGGASIFFRKSPSPIEVLNDIDKDVFDIFNDFRIVPEEDIRTFDFVTVREKFDTFLQTNYDTKKEQLYRNLYLSKCSFGGNRKTFGNRNVFCKTTRINQSLLKYKQRLSNIHLYNEDYKTVMLRYDSPDTFYFLDPPYENSDVRMYDYPIIDFKSMAELLTNIQGKFLMTINDSPVIRELFKDFIIEERPFSYSFNSKTKRKINIELIIKNYP